ncbi:related to hydrogen peroxide-inducible protein hic-5 [Cephalotrichum gorgonifer]|uniref:Related to hydrogen peroxide-inducible protein hic-5 n=1 Tax=Cephalotrichum gorgonifer TaxID=2041049 RepID=A0AAE8SWW5_9PEZI|nr:related to hydrogen peroxide-inducible protein hic-5 [Cephalotrichum gorgonifer]
MFGRGKPRDGSRKVTPPSAAYMTNDQFAAYLSDLRNNRMSRPGGSREQHAPAPTSTPIPREYSTTPPPRDCRSIDRAKTPSAMPPPQANHSSRAPSIATSSVRSRYSVGPNARDYYPQRQVAPLKPSDVVPTATYMERGQRWMEKEEAFSLREAMDDMKLEDSVQSKGTSADDQRLYEAALNEASELVWQHQHPTRQAAPDAPYRYRPHLRKNSYAHARTASVGMYGDEIVATGLARDCSRSVSGSSTESAGFSTNPQNPDEGVTSSDNGKVTDSRPTAPGKSFSSISSARRAAVPNGPRQNPAPRGRRNISGEIGKPFSVDQIWEEPEAGPVWDKEPPRRNFSPVLEARGKNPLTRVHFSPPKPSAFSKEDIHKNPPSRSRDAQYTTNPPTARAPPPADAERIQGVEVRADDIRQATSMKLKDRSEKLPTPSAVSDNPSRPIVSFNASWTPPDQSTDRRPERGCGPPAMAIPSIVTDQDREVAGPPASFAIPSINVDDGGIKTKISIPTIQEPSPPIPSINVPSVNVPSINVDDSPQDGGVPIIVTPDENRNGSARPLPQPGKPSCRSRAPRPPPGTFPRGASLCHECGFPLQGRFVQLAGSADKFHPQCLSCFTCGTSLEALEISPEPDSFRSERLDRIRRRAAGEVLEEVQGKTMAEDGDDRLRFYCHLDWHELYAPRCKHCTTPILGEHIVALGEHWHYGHFFCAECGDPFEHGMTHIEKDGYAWCIKCQTKRTERHAPKCKMCKIAVVGQYIKALGGEWHEACFRCAHCSGGFDDGQIFPTEDPSGSMIILCTSCRMRELKK